MHCTHIYYNYLLITNRIVKILALSIVPLQLAVSKIYPMEDVTFVKNRTFKKISNICFLNALYLTDSYQTSQF
jgi:hypothetical protein